MNLESVTRRARDGALALAIAGALGSANGEAPSVAATPAICASGTPAVTRAATETPGRVPTTSAPIPTQAALEPEVNPPGDIPDNQAFVTYRSAAGGYAIAMPEGWARTESSSNVIFADKLHRFTVEITCAAAAPTVADVKANQVPWLGRQVPAFELVEVKALALPAGPAILVRYRTNSAPDEVTGKQVRLDVDRYEVFKDGAVAVISLAVPAGSDNVDVSNQVSRSFAWTA